MRVQLEIEILGRIHEGCARARTRAYRDVRSIAQLFQAPAPKIRAPALPTNSADAALLVTLSPGSHTARVSGISGTPGVALVEVYKAPQQVTNSALLVSNRYIVLDSPINPIQWLRNWKLLGEFKGIAEMHAW